MKIIASSLLFQILSLVCGSLMTYNIVHLHDFKKGTDEMKNEHTLTGEPGDVHLPEIPNLAGIVQLI